MDFRSTTITDHIATRKCRGVLETLWKLVVFGSGLAAVTAVAILFSACANEKRIEVAGGSKIEIVSYLVRDRVVPFDWLTMRSTIIVGFRIVPPLEITRGFSVKGKLYLNDKAISEDLVSVLDGPVGNVGFGIHSLSGSLQRGDPYSIPEGKYKIEIALLNAKQRVVSEVRNDIERRNLSRTFMDPRGDLRTYEYVTEGVFKEIDGGMHRDEKFRCGQGDTLSVFKKGSVERIYSHTIPGASDCVDALHIDISHNEYRSIHLGLRADGDLGVVSVRVDNPNGEFGELRTDVLSFGPVGELSEIVLMDRKNRTARVSRGPKIIEESVVSVLRNKTQAYWLTLKVSDAAEPGEYHGSLVIESEREQLKRIPLIVRLLPLRLTDTDVQYGMMMDYAFYEMDNREWSEEERKQIRQSGDLIYRDLREHGMTLVFPHSHFYYRTDLEGEPILESLRAGLESYRRYSFPGPFVWYLGHLLQTAKPKHPGSILGYDPITAKKRLARLLARFEAMAQELGIPKEKLVVQLVDEPDSDQRERMKAGKQLHKVAQQKGFKVLITRSWPEADVICGDGEEAERLHRAGKEWWIYPNGTLKSRNLAYTRYAFGFGAWHRGVDGVVPWTFQMTQGSNGNPFTVLDGPEVMVAYPGVGGPVATPTWEVIREGINDYKYIYLLNQMIADGKRSGNPRASRIEGQLEQFRSNLGESPGYAEFQHGDWTAVAFEERRKQIVDWALELQKGDPSVFHSKRKISY
jgi:hypothetical protein